MATPITKVKYGINRMTLKGRKKFREYSNGQRDVPLAEDDPGFLRNMLDYVVAKHPGWSLTGYAPYEDPKETAE